MCDGNAVSGHLRCWGQVEGTDSMVQGRSSGVLLTVFLLISQTLNLSLFVFHDLRFSFLAEGFVG